MGIYLCLLDGESNCFYVGIAIGYDVDGDRPSTAVPLPQCLAETPASSAQYPSAQ